MPELDVHDAPDKVETIAQQEEDAPGGTCIEEGNKVIPAEVLNAAGQHSDSCLYAGRSKEYPGCSYKGEGEEPGEKTI